MSQLGYLPGYGVDAEKHMELPKAWRPRYKRSSRKETGNILDELEHFTGYQCKSLIRALSRGQRGKLGVAALGPMPTRCGGRCLRCGSFPGGSAPSRWPRSCLLEVLERCGKHRLRPAGGAVSCYADEPGHHGPDP